PVCGRQPMSISQAAQGPQSLRAPGTHRPWSSHASPKVQTLKSSHGAPGAMTPRQIPPSQTSSRVHGLPSLQDAPGAGVPVQVPATQTSGAVHWSKSLQGVPSGATESGHSPLAPAHTSGASQAESAGRQTVPLAENWQLSSQQ